MPANIKLAISLLRLNPMTQTMQLPEPNIETINDCGDIPSNAPGAMTTNRRPVSLRVFLRAGCCGINILNRTA